MMCHSQSDSYTYRYFIDLVAFKENKLHAKAKDTAYIQESFKINMSFENLFCINLLNL